MSQKFKNIEQKFNKFLTQIKNKKFITKLTTF